MRLKLGQGLGAACTALLVHACESGIPSTAEPVEFAVVAELTGGFRAFDVPARVVLSNDAAYADFLEGVWADRNPRPPPRDSLLELGYPVNFSREILVVGAMGSQRSTGYSIEVDGMWEDSGTLWVRMTETRPGPRCVNGAAITYPLVTVVVQRSGLHVEFVDESATRQC